MAYTLGNKRAKNCCKRTILVQLIVENVVTCFLEHSVVMACHILYGRPYCNDAKEGVDTITPPKLNRG